MKDKNFIEGIMDEYKEKVFGFALSQLKSITDAEELAAQIHYEVYMAFIEFLETLPKMSVKLKNISKELDEEIYTIDKTQYPERFHNLCRVIDRDLLTSTDIRTRVLDLLQKSNILKPLTKTQKKSVNTILFNIALPNKISH